jgi:ferredoxin
VIYFSQTGNTHKVAEVIQETLAATAGSCALVRLEEADPQMVERYDLIGLGTPAFYFREPANVQKFIELLPDHGGRPKPFFFFVTHGGTPGGIYRRVSDLAARRGFRCLDFFQCLGYDTYPPYAQRVPASGAGHPDPGDLAAAGAFARRVIEKARRASWPAPEIPGNALTGAVAGWFGHESLKRMMRWGFLPRKNLSRELCTKCGLCAENCPAEVIKLAPYPSFTEEKCIACYHCERICPQQAYRNNWVPFKLATGEYLNQMVRKLGRKRDI